MEVEMRREKIAGEIGWGKREKGFAWRGKI